MGDDKINWDKAKEIIHEKSDWEELAEECSILAKKIGLTKEDSDQIIYKVRHPEWDQIRADILMLTYQWLEYCEYCYLTFDQLWYDFIGQSIKHNKINDFVVDNFTAIENWMEYKDYGAQEDAEGVYND